MKKQKVLQNAELSPITSNFVECEDDDDGSLYKNCIRCGQGQYQFKHGVCLKCGENNWIVEIEKPKTEKLGIVELMDN